MLPKPLRFLWGNLTVQEIKKFSLLSMVLFFIITAHWLLRPLKDGIFKSMVGISYQPKAKLLSLFLIVILVLLYSKLVDLVQKHRLFYIICSFYGLGYLIIAWLLSSPIIGLANTVASPKRFLGWFSYIFIESMATILMALFWSFVASVTDSEAAKKGYPLIITVSQLGSLIGPTLARKAEFFGLPLLMIIAAISILIVPFIIKIFMNVIVKKECKLAGIQKEEKTKTGAWEGLKLLLTKPYLLGIFVIATFYEIIGTIVDFQMKVLADKQFVTAEQFTSFMGLFGQWVGVIAIVFALFGTSFLMRKFGLVFCLLAFPVSMGVVLAYFWMKPVLYVAFIAVVMLKALSFALNNPSKEMMYIPTSKDVKFKAKSWIDVFGARGAKGTGSLVNNTFAHSAPLLLFYGTVVSFGLIGVWIVAAIFVGKTFNTLTKHNKIIE